MAREKSLFVAAAVVSLLAACSSASTESSQKVVDIKDIVLTNLSGDCADYSSNYSASVKDVNENQIFVSKFDVSDDEISCSISSNAIPNYDFNDVSAHFATAVSTQNLSLSIPRNPVFANSPTAIDMQTYNAVMLNGVLLDQFSDGCYKPEDANADENGHVSIGCGSNANWRLNPMGPVKFGTDSHNGHTQPEGLYHYHGNPMALFDPEETELGSPVIGFAADGFPIYGPHFIDPMSGQMSVAKSGFTLKSGARPTVEGSPSGTYDGTYIQDYEFTNAGTLDQCNGMTIDGQYGYYVTSSYPYVMACYQGTPDESFEKASPPINSSAIVKNVAVAIFSGLTIFVFFVVRRSRRKKAITETQTSTRNIPHVNWS